MAPPLYFSLAQCGVSGLITTQIACTLFNPRNVPEFFKDPTIYIKLPLFTRREALTFYLSSATSIISSRKWVHVLAALMMVTVTTAAAGPVA